MSDLTQNITSGYIELPVTTDPNVLVQQALASLAASLPGWTPNEGQLDVLLLEQFAQMTAETAQVAAVVPLAIFQYFGSLVGINPETGAYATVPTTWTMQDTAGYTVPSGTVVAWQILGNVQVEFVTTAPIVVPNGSSSAAGVVLQAVVLGTAGNDVPDATTLVPVTQLAYVTSVVTTAISSGGSNAETQSAYLNRLSNELQLLTPRPILPADFAALAPSVTGVYRAVAINGLNPGRTITAAGITSGSPDVVDPAASFTLGDVGKSITGTDIPGSTTISSVLVAGRTLSAASLTSGSPDLTCSTAAFTSNDIDRPVTGTGVPSGTTISSISSGTVAVMSANASATESSESIVLGALASCQTAVMSANASATVASESVVLGDLTGQERCVTVAAVDIDGNALTSTVENALSTYLESQREVNFLVPVIGPTYSAIDVTFTAVAYAGQATATVQAACVAALTSFLSQANWGTQTTIVNGTITDGSPTVTGVALPSGNTPPGLAVNQPISGVGIPSGTTISAISGTTITLSQNATATGTVILTVSLLGTWDASATVVRYLALIGVVSAVPGVQYVQSLSFAIHGNSLATTDVSLPGDAPMTQVGTITPAVVSGT